jgi:DNA-binding GntR family transcriptional regulator
MLVLQPLPSASPMVTLELADGQCLVTGNRRNQESRDRLLRRLRAEFREMPGMRLTDSQSARLCGLSHAVCRRVLATLVSEGTLWKGGDGRYAVRAR